MEGSEYVIKLRGLPYSATVEDVMDFLSGVNIYNGRKGVHLTELRSGRSSGQCYVELVSQEDMELACKKHKQNFGKRYIEVFKGTRDWLNWATKPYLAKKNRVIRIRPGAGVVRIRGLPFDCCYEDIEKFFDGLELIPDGINILSDHTGRSSGEAFVQFVDKDTAERALEKDRETIGHRYIEVFLSSADEAYSHTSFNGQEGQSRPSPYERPGGDRFGGPSYYGGPKNFGGPKIFGGPNHFGSPNHFGGPNKFGGPNNLGAAWNRNGSGLGNGWGGVGGGTSGRGRGGADYTTVHMRGLPYNATLIDISYFFAPVRPLNIAILYDDDKRPSGKADVIFETQADALWAMERDKCHMDNRYIELFLESPDGRGGVSGRRGRGNFNSKLQK